MRITKLTRIALLAVAAVCLIAAPLYAADGKPVTVADILKAANAPLTADQTKKIADTLATPGFEAMMGINAVFTAPQLKALTAAFGTFPGMPGPDGAAMPETPKFLFQALQFEKAGCTLTDQQIEKIKKLEMGEDMMNAMTAIFDQKQMDTMMAGFGGGQQ